MPKTLAEDLDVLLAVFDGKLNSRIVEKLRTIRGKLVTLWYKGLVKSNHSVMEFVLASYFLLRGFNIEVEKSLENNLVCDIYAEKDGLSYIVEIETGFVPPSNAIDPVNYRRAREISKIARYSKYSDLFALATPPYHILQIPEELVVSPGKRDLEKLLEMKQLLDQYYKSPPISVRDLLEAKVDYVYIVDVDHLKIIEIKAEDYVKNICKKSILSTRVYKLVDIR
ncbi:MAG: hypothetical protein DRJ52_01905 [Thermoprotei archaeon]|nr:MAG: hypothetical protein DRJ52_01905 [Thermoprotei archaeon]RLE97712.1 MAG: hypothetical protein DRJ63_08745 [Thermoprotei archaeon]